MWKSSSNKRIGILTGLALAAFSAALEAAPISSLAVVFNGSNKQFAAGVTTNTAGSGQIWVQAFLSPDAGQTINLQLLDNGQAVANGMSPASLVTQNAVVTYGFPSSTPLPVTFYRSGSGLTIRATLSGSTITAESASFSVAVGSASRLVVLAPGMTHAPGTNPSLTSGVSGTASDQTPLQAFPITVILTDSSFNKVSTLNHNISIVSGDLTTYAPSGTLSLGSGDFNVAINAARTSRQFTVSDQTDGSILSGAVTVQTSGPPEQEVFPFPSPFNPARDGAMTFRFHQNESGHAVLKIKDQFGESVWETGMDASSGFTDISWNGRNDNGVLVASGVYYAVLEIKGSVKSKKRFGVIK